MGELDTPFDLGLFEFEESDAHDEDKEGGNEAECALPDFFGRGP